MAKKRTYSPSEVKQQADKARSRTRVNGKGKQMKSDAELACCLLDR